MAQQLHPNTISKPSSFKADLPVSDLTRMLFEIQSSGLAELYEQLNKSISISKIIEDSKSFQRSSDKAIQQICK